MYLMKVAPYGPEVKSSRYYQDLAAQRINPGVEERNEKTIAIARGMHLVACSPLRRAQETARMITPGVRIDDDLREVPFILDDVPQVTSARARESFVRAFITDSLPERRKSIQARIERVLNRYGPNELCISHTFFIRLLQLQVEDNIFTHPEKLTKHILPEKRVMEYYEMIKIR